jgi:hypothetical protein
MTAKGCSYNGGMCHPIIEQCNGCNRTTAYESGFYCTACPAPALKWKSGNCNLATHVTSTVVVAKQKINPIKASKRGNR